MIHIPIVYWSGFGIFKQNRGNPDEIGMVGRFHNFISVLLFLFRDTFVDFFWLRVANNFENLGVSFPGKYKLTHLKKYSL